MALIGAFHTLLSGGSLGKHQLIARFYYGTWRLRPRTQARVPVWTWQRYWKGCPWHPLSLWMLPPSGSSPLRWHFRLLFPLSKESEICRPFQWPPLESKLFCTRGSTMCPKYHRMWPILQFSRPFILHHTTRQSKGSCIYHALLGHLLFMFRRHLLGERVTNCW